MEDRLLTVPEVLARLRISRDTLYKLLRSGSLGSVLIAERVRRIPESALQAYLASVQDQPMDAA